MKKGFILLFSVCLCSVYAVDNQISETKQKRFGSDVTPKERSSYNQELREQKQQQINEKKEEMLEQKEQRKEMKEERKQEHMKKHINQPNQQGNKHKGMM